MEDGVIELQNISYSISGNLIIQDVNWQVKKTQHSLILGVSGSGKTTLLHLLAGLLKPTNGSISINNQDISKLQGSALDAWRGRNIGMVFQSLHLIKSLTVIDNLRIAQSMAGFAEDNARIKQLLERLSLTDKSNHYPHQISVGQAQRVAIARAVVNKPAWILADEATSALDDGNCMEMLNLLESQAEEYGATLMIATHDQRIKNRYTHQLVLQQNTRQAA